MKFYKIATPHWIQRIYPNYIWKIPNNEQKIFLTFDDGPTPEITPFVLKILNKLNIKATFFVVGKQIEKYPQLFREIIAEKHAVANHTYSHLHGWKTRPKRYVHEILKTQELIYKYAPSASRCFRPPYGKFSFPIKRFLKKNNYKIIMWSLLAADFDPNVPPKQCQQNILQNIQVGDIIVLHDSLKCARKIKVFLHETLETLLMQNFNFGTIE